MHAHGAGVAHQANSMACSRLAVLLRYSQRHMAPSLASMLSTNVPSVTGAGRCQTMAAAVGRQTRRTQAAPQHEGGAYSDRNSAAQRRADGDQSEPSWRGSAGSRDQGGRAAAGGGSRGGTASRGAPSAQRGRTQGRGNSSRPQSQRSHHRQAPPQDARQQPEGRSAVRSSSALRPVAPPTPADAAALRSPASDAAADEAQLNTVSPNDLWVPSGRSTCSRSYQLSAGHWGRV